MATFKSFFKMLFSFAPWIAFLLIARNSMAVAIAEMLGLSRQQIVSGVASFQGVGNRMEVVRLPGRRIILNDCYNANPQSVAAGLEVLAKSTGSHKLAILGDMSSERERDTVHVPLGRWTEEA